MTSDADAVDAHGRGPLRGIRVVELASLGPGPHAAMMLGDLGADVVRIDRPPGSLDLAKGRPDWMLRNRRSVAANLKIDADLALVLDLIDRADVVVEGNRPGVAERLGVGPDVCLARNPGLIYARVTGWGQEGPRASTAGHDINYLSLTGALHAMGRAESPPVPPLNLVADIAGGSFTLVMGVLAALVERARTGRGQVIDAAMVDGVGVTLQMIWALLGLGEWRDERATNLLDGSCPFYDSYACADGGFIAVGALEPQFYRAFISGLGLELETLPDRDDRANWPQLRAVFAERIGARPRAEWTAIFDGTDACVTPVLTFAEATSDAHLAARGALTRLGGVWQAMPAPRFSAHAAATPTAPREPDADRSAVLADWLGR